MSAPGDLLPLPVGHLHGNGPDGALVRVGTDQVVLPDRLFTAWALAHGLPDRPADEPWTVDALLTTGAAQGLGDLRAALDDLVADRVVRLVDPAAGRPFAEQHRLVLQVLGLGNDPDRPHSWSLGLLGQPLVEVNGTVLDLVEHADLHPDLWSAVEATATSARRAGRTDPADTDPDRLLAEVLPVLHGLLAADVVHLDTRYVMA